MTARTGTRTVKIEDLITDVFVRTKLDDDHVMYLATLTEAGTEFDPILITPDMEVIDGRHRIEAALLFDDTEIEARVVKVADRSELITMAFEANTGGAKPPTQADIDHTIKLLMEEKLTQSEIAERIGLLPSQVKRRMTEVRKKETRRKVIAAVHDIRENDMTVRESAELHGVDPSAVKVAMSGGGRRKKVSEDRREKLAGIMKTYGSLSRKNGSLLADVMEALGEGEAKYDEVAEILSSLEKKVKGQTRALTNWRKRLEAGEAS
ncbi:hypothetical protein CL629_02745 [bacterium]|nr:hypothetical protein [bacterium]